MCYSLTEVNTMAIYIDEGIEFYHRVKRSKDFKMSVSHFHNKHELYYLVKGSSRYFINNEIFAVNAGDMIFIPKGAFHKTNIEQNKDAERIILVFDDDFAGSEYKKHINQLINKKHIRFPEHELLKIGELFNKIEKECQKKDSDYVEMQKLYLRELLILISRHRVSDSLVKQGHSFKLIEDIMRYISENIDADLSLSTLAQKYSISPNYLSKQFKKISGLHLSEYISISRINMAENLLKTQKLPITEIATRCGFNDSNYFAAVFKRYKGITPKKYSILNN